MGGGEWVYSERQNDFFATSEVAFHSGMVVSRVLAKSGRGLEGPYIHDPQVEG